MGFPARPKMSYKAAEKQKRMVNRKGKRTMRKVRKFDNHSQKIERDIKLQCQGNWRKNCYGKMMSAYVKRKKISNIEEKVAPRVFP